MARHLIAILIICFAIAFAFGAMTAIRWPSLMMFAGMMFEQDPLNGLAGINWRELGIAYGAPYFLAAFCFYAAALSLTRRQHGSFSWYAMACISGFPCAFLVDFESGWWRDPSAGEGAVAGAAAAATLLALAVWVLRKRKPKLEKPAAEKVMIADPDMQVVYVPAKPDQPKRPVRAMPVPAAIARQRAHFAAEGRKMMAKRQRQAR